MTNTPRYRITTPIPGIAYSTREAIFPEGHEPTDEEIQEVARVFNCINKTFNTPEPSAPVSTPFNVTLLREENAQLKEFQDKTMQLLEIIKTQSPDVFESANSILNAK